jgi:hypothetical protein
MSDLSQPITDNGKVQEQKSQVQVEPKQQVQPKEKGKNKVLVSLVIALSVILLVIVGYIVYIQFFKEDVVDTTDNTQQEQEDITADTETEDVVDETEDGDEEENTVVEVEDDGYTTFTGELLTAQLPEGWSIVEYFDGNGTESLPDMGLDYEGLTAIDIISPDSRQVFSIQAVSGIGFAGCPSYALFDDDNEAYRFEQESMSDDMGEPLNITDYTGQEYEEFEFLGVTFRRIDDKYFYDMKEGNNYFEPPCVEGLLTLEGLFFTDTDGTIYEAYFYGPTEDSTEDDLPIVDQILESVEII